MTAGKIDVWSCGHAEAVLLSQKDGRRVWRCDRCESEIHDYRRTADPPDVTEDDRRVARALLEAFSFSKWWRPHDVSGDLSEVFLPTTPFNLLAVARAAIEAYRQDG